MRYIIEETEEGEVIISESAGSYFQEEWFWGDYSRRKYKAIYGAHPAALGSFFQLEKENKITVAKHYKNFEEFMGDYVELFL